MTSEMHSVSCVCGEPEPEVTPELVSAHVCPVPALFDPIDFDGLFPRPTRKPPPRPASGRR